MNRTGWLNGILVAFAMLPLWTGCGSQDTSKDTSGDTDADTDADTDTDTDSDVQPVWDQFHIETSATLNGIYAAGRTAYAVGDAGTFWSYKPATDWVETEVDVDGEDLHGLWGSGSEDTLAFVAVGNAGKVVVYEGSALNVEDLGTNDFNRVHGPSIDVLYAVGWGGLFKRDGGAWTFDSTLPGSQYNDVWASNAAVFVIGEAGAIYFHAADAWSPMESPTSANLYAISGTSESDIWAVGEEGVVLHYNGQKWTQNESGVTETLWAVSAIAADAAVAVGNNGVAIRWDGTKWKDMPSGVDNNLYTVSCSSASECWAAGNRGMTLQYTTGE